MLALALLATACSDGSSTVDASRPDAGRDLASLDLQLPADSSAELGYADFREVGVTDIASDGPTTLSFKVMTFNIGTTEGLDHDSGDDGYTQKMADITNDLYQNSLSWNPAEKALTAFLAQHQPDIVAFQEGFYDPWCESIAVDPALDFVCKDYTPTRPWQLRRLVGPDYQLAYANDQPDNFIAVKKSLGKIVGCPLDAVCVEGLHGLPPASGCTSRPRVGSIEVELNDGRKLVVVVMHGTSGVKLEDMLCRVDQVNQIFVDRGDGKPAAFGEANIVMGDLNTDPFLPPIDPSVVAWNGFVGQGKTFSYISSDSAIGPATYLDVVRIDHVVSDKVRGSCIVPGSTPGVPPVFADAIYWDHNPVLCDVSY